MDRWKRVFDQSKYHCVYCEVDRDTPGRARKVDVAVMAAELERLLRLQHESKLSELDRSDLGPR